MHDKVRGLPDLADLPRRCDRRTAATLLTQYFFRTSPRTLERWPLSWRLLNGRAHCETEELFQVAESMLARAPCIRGGRADNTACGGPMSAQVVGERLASGSASQSSPPLRDTFDSDAGTAA